MNKPTISEYLNFLNTCDMDKNPRKIVVFHHADMDGYMAAASAYRGLRSAFYKDNYASSLSLQELYQGVTFKEVNYGRFKDEDILSLVTEHTDVFVLDFSFPRELSDQIHEKAGFFKIIDHHASSQRDVGDRPYAYFDMESSGARMAFEYFNPTEEVPLAVILVDNRDLWKKDTGWEDAFHESLMSQLSATKSLAKDYNTAFVIDLLIYLKDPVSDSMVHKAVKDGMAMISRRDAGIRSMCDDKKILKTLIGGHPAIVFNAPIDQSDACEYVYNQPKYKNFIAAAFNISGDKMTFSLRKHKDLDVDLSKIAEIHYQGGGHKVAAGFATDIPRGMNIILNKEKWALCWPAAAVSEAMQHESMVDVAKRLTEIPAVLRSRTTCETDTSLLQILPYIVLRSKEGEYFTYNRPSSGTESRLHGNDSIGLGGHVDTAPPDNMPIELHLGYEAQRELEEEVGFNNPLIPATIAKMFNEGNFALINVTDRPVDAVHLGMVFIIDINDKKELTKIEQSEVINARWSTLPQLKVLKSPETWTSVIINQIL